MSSNKKIIIATGGTGGHVFPAYSLAKFFIQDNKSVEIITDKRGLKFLEKQKKLKLILNNSTTIYKNNIIKSFLSLILIFYSFLKSLIILYKKKPSIVFGMGGYSSFPVCLAAKVLKIPFIIYENNLLLGKSNKYLLPYAYKIFVSYSELQGINKRFQKKIIHTGNILRNEILNFVPNKKDYSKNTLNILILGGSQAAKSFGEILPAIFEKCVNENIKLKIFQQCIAGQNDKLFKKYTEMKIDFELFNFTHNIIEYFSKTDFVITRSGSSIISELLNCNIPFVSIPFPYSADNHQEKNAIYFKNKGYSFHIEEEKMRTDLFPLIKTIYKDKKILEEIIDKQSKYSDKEVFKKIKREIQTLIHD